MPNVIINELEINNNANIMFAATYGRGVWQTELPSNIAPSAGFNYNIIGQCSGTIQLENQSTFYDSVKWDFGDGTINYNNNPNHIYQASGNYDISLIAFNQIGSDTITQNITLDIIEPPIVAEQYNCFPSTFNFSATPSDPNSTINWYSDQIGLNLLYQGQNFTTEELSVPTTFYVKENQLGSIIVDGPEDENALGSGGFHGNTEWQQVFSSSNNAILKSVYLYAEQNFSIDIVLKLSDGTTIESTTVNLVQGENTVELNFNIPIAQNMTLGIEGDNEGLWRNDNVSDYPIAIGNDIVITESTAGEEYFYYFYNWEVQEFCSSNLVQVVANVGSLEPLNIDVDNQCSFNSYTLTANGNFNSFIWNNETESPVLVVEEAGEYSVIAIDNDGCSTIQSVNVPTINMFDISTGIQNICQGTPIILQATPGLESYLWNNGEESNVIEINSNGTYSVTATDFNECEYSDEIDIVFNDVLDVNIEAPDGTTICRGTEFLLAALGGQNYIWNNIFMGDNYIISENTTGTKNYYVSFQNDNGCNSIDSIEIQIIDCSSIDELNENSIVLFPNPNNGDFTVFHKANQDKVQLINLFDTRNRLIETRKVKYSNNQLIEKFNVNSISKGIYFIELIGQQDKHYQKIIVQ
jgi:PKD repeat protein